MAFSVSRLTRLPLAYYCALFFGLAVTILTLFAPHWLLGRFVSVTGISHVIHAATPPLGRKAGLFLAILFGGLTAAVIAVPYFLKRLFLKPKRAPFFQAKPIIVPNTAPSAAHTAVEDDVPPTRRPIFADQELGAPFMSDEVLELAKAKEFDAPADWSPVETHEAPVYKPKYSWLDEATAGPPALQTEAQVTPVDVPTPAYQGSDSVHEAVTEPAIFAPINATPAPETPAPDTHASTPATHQEGLTLNEMIARLEAGLAHRTTTPPEPPVAHPAPFSGQMATPVAPPLAVVPTSPQPQDRDGKLFDAMRTIGKLVGGAAR